MRVYLILDYQIFLLLNCNLHLSSTPPPTYHCIEMTFSRLSLSEINFAL